MPKKLTADARNALLTAAAEEATRQGDRRIGTEHLLLALLHDPKSRAAQALNVSLDAARVASHTLDVAALTSLGITVASVPDARPRARIRRLRPLTSGAREVLVRSINESRASKSRQVDTTHFLLALLECQEPDPAAQLMRALKVSPDDVRSRLSDAAA